MLRLITSRELALYGAQLDEYRAEIKRLHGLLQHERERSEKAINAMLHAEKKPLINLDKHMTMEQEENVKQQLWDLFDEGEKLTEEQVLEKLQGHE